MIVARPALERRSAWQRSWKSVLDCNNLVFWQDRSFPTWFPSNLLCVPVCACVCVIWLLYFHSYNFIFALVISGCGLPLCQPLKTTSSANARPWHVDFNFNHVFLSMFITHHVASYYKSYSKFYYKSYYISCYISYYVILPYHLTYHHSRNSGIQYHNIPTNMTWVSSDNARSNCWMRTLGGLLPRQVTWASMQRPTFDMSRSVENRSVAHQFGQPFCGQARQMRKAVSKLVDSSCQTFNVEIVDGNSWMKMMKCKCHLFRALRALTFFYHRHTVWEVGKTFRPSIFSI